MVSEDIREKDGHFPFIYKRKFYIRITYILNTVEQSTNVVKNIIK